MTKRAPFALERWLALHEPNATHHLAGIGLAPLSLGDLSEFGIRLPAELTLGYLPSNGLGELREAIAGIYEHQTPDRVLVTTGGIEALNVALDALALPGKKAIVMTPGYQGLSEPLRERGMQILPWRLSFEQGWEPDFTEFEQLLAEKPALVVLNSPHNPTGFCFSSDQLREVVEKAEAAGATVVADEVYRGLGTTLSVADFSEKAVAIGSLSKLYGLPGLRIGWIVGAPSVLERAWGAKDYHTLSNNTLGEWLAVEVLRRHDEFLSRAEKLAKENWGILERFLEKHRDCFEWVPPRSGLSVFPRLKHGTSDAFCAALMEAGLLVLPGTVYEEPFHLRFGFGSPSPEGLEALSTLITEKKSSFLHPEREGRG
ncbi:MAG: aminotransferase class I/II-fold pyridoxal phosphate-dependent enzyme [Bacteroidota bacterium]